MVLGVVKGVPNPIDQDIISYAGYALKPFQRLKKSFLEDLRAYRESKGQACPPVPPKWSGKGGEPTGFFFQGTVPIAMTEVNFAFAFARSGRMSSSTGS